MCSHSTLNCYDSVAVKITVTIFRWQKIIYIKSNATRQVLCYDALESSIREGLLGISKVDGGTIVKSIFG
jgi:hypothetical protein